MLFKTSISLFTLTAGIFSHPVTAFVPTASCCSRSLALPSLAGETNDNKDSSGQSQAQSLRDKAAELRAEIAALEGKTVQQVQQEAQQKKDATQQRIAAAERQRTETKPRGDYRGRMLEVPYNRQDMVEQAARAVERAYKDGITRQTVRFALIKEDQSFVDLELWPGGAEQMSREAAKPLTRDLLKTMRLDKEQVFLPPEIKEQDVWDFDGSALISSEAKQGPKHDVQALVLPNTDAKYIKDIETIDASMGDRLFLLVNPFWRNLDSWGINLLQPGAKKKAQQIIFDKGYDETYHFLRFSVRGEECAAIKAYPYDWQIFAYLEDPMGWDQAIRLGSSAEDPKSEYITSLLNERPEFKLSRNMRKMSR